MFYNIDDLRSIKNLMMKFLFLQVEPAFVGRQVFFSTDKEKKNIETYCIGN